MRHELKISGDAKGGDGEGKGARTCMISLKGAYAILMGLEGGGGAAEGP